MAKRNPRSRHDAQIRPWVRKIFPEIKDALQRKYPQGRGVARGWHRSEKGAWKKKLGSTRMANGIPVHIFFEVQKWNGDTTVSGRLKSRKGNFDEIDLIVTLYNNASDFPDLRILHEELVESLRHEFEHTSQPGIREFRPSSRNIKEEFYRNYFNNEEIAAYTSGIYARAKKTRSSFKSLLELHLQRVYDEFQKVISEREFQAYAQAMVNYAQKRYPGLTRSNMNNPKKKSAKKRSSARKESAAEKKAISAYKRKLKADKRTKWTVIDDDKTYTLIVSAPLDSDLSGYADYGWDTGAFRFLEESYSESGPFPGPSSRGSKEKPYREWGLVRSEKVLTPAQAKKMRKDIEKEAEKRRKKTLEFVEEFERMKAEGTLPKPRKLTKKEIGKLFPRKSKVTPSSNPNPSRTEEERITDEMMLSPGALARMEHGWRAMNLDGIGRTFKNRTDALAYSRTKSKKKNPPKNRRKNYAVSPSELVPIIKRWARVEHCDGDLVVMTGNKWSRDVRKTDADVVVCCRSKLLREIRKQGDVMEEFSELVGEHGYSYILKGDEIQIHSLGINPKKTGRKR